MGKEPEQIIRNLQWLHDERLWVEISNKATDIRKQITGDALSLLKQKRKCPHCGKTFEGSWDNERETGG